MKHAARSALGAAFALLVAIPALAEDWSTVPTPSGGPAQPIGRYANGCIGGAATMPLDGPGFQVVNPARRRYFGHPDMIDYLTKLGRRVADAGLGTMLIGDIAQPRGGPMRSGHASHQIGLDADIWLHLDLPPLPRSRREIAELPGMVDRATRRVIPERWTNAQADLIRTAADDPRVARIFVSPSIKLALCARDWSDRSWLRLVRPWWGHEAHLHVRLNCPAGAANCIAQDPQPVGDGCGDELLSWLEAPKPPAGIPKAPPPLPTACSPVLAGSPDN
jgi:penicillin-insensitive murein endopeptidase